MKRLELKIGDGRFLVLGTIGTGKSSELLRIAEQRASKSLVVQLDLVSHFRNVVGNEAALEGVTSWEVVFLAALAIARAAKDGFDVELPKGALEELGLAWRRAADKSEVPETQDAEVDLLKLARSMIILASSAAGGSAAATAAQTVLTPLDAAKVRWKLNMGRAKKRLDDQDAEIQTLVQAANAIINDVQYQLGRPVLLVLDGLDRVQRKEAALSLFRDSTILSQLECQSVVCGPFVLRHDAALAAVRGFDVELLVNEPVLDFDEPDVHGPGVAFMLDVFERRTRDLALSIEKGIVEELAYRSGGRVRDFIKLVRELAATVRLDGADVARTSHLKTALKKQRLLLETGLTADHIDVLKSVMDDPRRRPPGGDLGYDLLRNSRLLPYLS